MVIRIRWENNIVWPLLMLYMLQFFFGAHKAVFAVCLLWMAYLTIKNSSFTVMLPRVSGLLFFCIVIVGSIFVGFFANEFNDVVRDIFYSCQSILIITLGYLYCRLDNKKSIKKTLYVAGIIMSVITLIRIIINIPNLSDLDSVRSIGNLNVYEVAMIVSIMIADKILLKKVIFSKTKDWLAIFIMLIKIIISMGRTEMVSMVIMVGIIFVMDIYFSKKKSRDILKIGGVLLLAAALIVAMYAVLPQEAKDEFTTKIDNSFNEVEADLEYDNFIEAISHWRGFEIDQAQKQWKNSDVMTQLIGGGFGTFIKMKYLPSEYTEDMHKGNSISILHNTYYTLLIKCGLIGVAAILWLYVSNLLLVFRPKYRRNKEQLATLCALTAAIMFMSYIVMANYNGGMYITWGIMTGWTNALIRNNNNEKTLT